MMAIVRKTVVAMLALTGIVVLAGGLKATADPPSAALAATPPMGWNSWNKFGCDVSEELIRQDGRRHGRDRHEGRRLSVRRDRRLLAGARATPTATSSPTRSVSRPASRRWPTTSIRKGLKFGIYSDAGTETCARSVRAASGYEYQDATQYAAWGVDYLKYDWCNTPQGHDAQAAYAHDARRARRQSGRPIVFSICEWGTTKPWLWGEASATCGAPPATSGQLGLQEGLRRHGVVHILDLQDGLESYAGPGHWNDPDMLEVGNGGMTDDRVPRALQPVGDAGGAADGRQRYRAT